MRAWTSYKLRLSRQRSHVRAFRKSFQLKPVADRTGAITSDDILLFCTLRNEEVRLPYFLKYYRNLGVDHFIFVDNDSDDGGREFLAEQRDASVFLSKGSYRDARFGVDWLNYLQRKHADGHWTLVVDPDEFFVFPFCDTRTIRALTDWLDSSNVRSFSAMLLDMYPKGPFDRIPYERGRDPFEIANWFDAGNYSIRRNHYLWNLWIQGGPRARVFFTDDPERAPALNKIPLVKWQKRYAYVSSTHQLLPRGLNLVYAEDTGEKASGVLMHAKFLDSFTAKAREELVRGQHYADSHEYKSYARDGGESPDLWCKWSEKFINWRQLEILGLMSKGNWA